MILYNIQQVLITSYAQLALFILTYYLLILIYMYSVEIIYIFLHVIVVLN